MNRIRSLFRRKRNRYIGAGAIGLIAIVTGIHIGTRSAIPYAPAKRVLMDLYAPRDVGVLPSRANWRTLVRPADHYWPLQEASGDAIDSGAATALWDLSPVASPRQGVHTPIPVAGDTVDTTSEKGVWFDGLSGVALQEPADQTILGGRPNLVSITAVFVSHNGGANKRIYCQMGNIAATGFELRLASNDSLQLQGNGATSKVVSTVLSLDSGVPYCVTAVLDGRTSDAAAVYVNGSDWTPGSNDLSGTGSWDGVEKPTVGNFEGLGANTLQGGVMRLRLDYAAITLAQHQTLCGTLGDFNLTASKIDSADLSWTQTGTPRCFAQSATTALCFPGGEPAHTYSSALAGLIWSTEPDRTNRILDGLTPDCSGANWACTGAATTTTGQVAPDGSATASRISILAGVNQVEGASASGYTGSATLYPSFWIMCEDDEDWHVHNSQGVAYGDWHVNCDEIGQDAWTYVDGNSAFVDVDTAWTADAGGLAGFHFEDPDSASADVQVWGMTLTETAGLSIIPTTSTAQSTGAVTWEVSNTAAKYYRGVRGKLTLVADYAAGGCLDVTSGTNVGRQYGDGADWFAYDAASSLVYQANLALAGADTVVVRWNSLTPLSPGLFAEVLLNDASQTWDATPTSGWTSADPDTIQLSGYAATKCTAGIQRITIEDQP